MVAAFDYCLHGKGGAAPSIDTAMHGLVDAAHVDHLHPDSGIAHRHRRRRPGADQARSSATGSSWVPWRRPGFQLGLDIAAMQGGQPAGDRRASSAGTASPPGARPAPSARRNSLEIIRTAEAYLAEHGRPDPFGPVARLRAAAARRPGGAARRRAVPGAARAWRPPTGRRSATSPTPTRCSTSCPAPSTPGSPRSARPARTTSCAPRSARWCSTCRRTRRWRTSLARLRELHAALPRGLRRLLRAARHAGLARRCAAPTRRSCWCPASACSASARTSRPPASPASSTSTRST